MRKAFLTGVALVAMTIVAQADSLDDQIKAQTEQARIDRAYLTTPSCHMAIGAQKNADNIAHALGQGVAAFGGSPNPQLVEMARGQQNLADTMRAKCQAEVARTLGQ
jgi:hypothetical protein